MVISELYEYTDSFQQFFHRPSVWMPRASELALNGRDDLRQAISRYGGVHRIGKVAGLVKYSEWYYFEGQLELMYKLTLYLDTFHNSDYTVFPTVTEISRNGHHQLHSLIQYYGGCEFLAARLGLMRYKKQRDDLQFGKFDLKFAIQLLEFIRNNHMLRQPPMRNPVIAMPSRNYLDEDFDAQIEEFGGYENVARRLGLDFFADR